MIGLILLVGGSVAGGLVPKRLLVRTDPCLYLFELPRSRKGPLDAPIHIAPADQLPPDPGGRSVELFGERLWGNAGARRERAAIAAALARRSP